MWHSRWVGIRARVDAPWEVVWSVLVDWRQYARWNPYILNVVESPSSKLLDVTIAQPDGRIHEIRVRVVREQAERGWRWIERSRFAGMFRREYLCRVAPQGQGACLKFGFQVGGIFTRHAWWRTVCQTRLALRLMTDALRRVAEAGSIQAWLDPNYPRVSSDYRWMPIYQARVYHEVVKALQIIRRSPRPVETMSLEGWSCRRSAQGRAFVACDGAVSVGYHEEKLPAELHGLHPILVGSVCGRTFVLDGAHRIAGHLRAGKKSIMAVRLTEAETAACIRDGFETKVRFETPNILPPIELPRPARVSPSFVA
jgi:hypothetical protein